jgi:hypothetical protein
LISEVFYDAENSDDGQFFAGEGSAAPDARAGSSVARVFAVLTGQPGKSREAQAWRAENLAKQR